MKPRRTDFTRSLRRTLAIQGSWNYRSFLAGGLTYALLPLLSRIHAGDPVRLREAVLRHLEPFNAHPYLAPLAVGALARLEHDGEDPDRIRRFRTALAGPLGSAGDRLVWAGWRPFCLLSAVLLYSLGAGPWTVVAFFLLLYNAGHLALRIWAFRRGWRDGPRAVRALSADVFQRVGSWLVGTNALLAGMAAATVSLRLPAAPAAGGGAAIAAAVAALAGFRWPDRVRPVLVGLVIGAALVWLFP